MRYLLAIALGCAIACGIAAWDGNLFPCIGFACIAISCAGLAIVFRNDDVAEDCE